MVTIELPEQSEKLCALRVLCGDEIHHTYREDHPKLWYEIC